MKKTHMLGNNRVYVWGIPTKKKRLKKTYEILKPGDILVVKRMKSENIRRYLNDKPLLETLQNIIKKEIAINIPIDKIRHELKERLILVIGIVLFRYPDQYLENFNNSYRVCEEISSYLWNSKTYVNLIFLKKRFILIGSNISDEDIFAGLGYNIEGYKLKKSSLADALRTSLIRCGRTKIESFLNLLRNYGIYGRDPPLDTLLKALEIAYFDNLKRNPLLFYQSLNDLLPKVNKLLEEWGYRKLSLKELEEKVDLLHEKYWLAGFYRHPKAAGLPVLVEFTKRIKTKAKE